jgi:hypothetical protein
MTLAVILLFFLIFAFFAFSCAGLIYAVCRRADAIADASTIARLKAASVKAFELVSVPILAFLLVIVLFPETGGQFVFVIAFVAFVGAVAVGAAALPRRRAPPAT